MKKIMSMLLTLVMALGILLQWPAAANAAAEGEAAEADAAISEDAIKDGEYPPTDLAFVFFGFSVDIHVALRNELIRYAEEKYNCTVHVYDYHSDPTQMMQDLEDVIVQKYDAVFISDITGTAQESGIMERLHDAGVKTAMYCVDTGKQDFLQGLPAYDAGSMLAEMAGKWIEAHSSLQEKETIKFGLFGNPAEGENAMDRIQGMKDYIAENVPNGEVVMELVGFDRQAGYDGAVEMITAHPDLDIILSYGDGAGVGANEALREKIDRDDFAIFTIDGSEEVLRIMASGGLIRGSVAMGGGVNQARELLDNFMPILYGEEIEPVYYFHLWPVTYDNLYEYSQALGYENFKESDITIDIEPLYYWDGEPFDPNLVYDK